jgi:hypothetical protein
MNTIEETATISFFTRFFFDTGFEEVLLERLLNKSKVEVLDSLMGCDLGNICAKAERQTSEKSVNEN